MASRDGRAAWGGAKAPFLQIIHRVDKLQGWFPESSLVTLKAR